MTHNGVETVAFQPGWVIDTTTGSTTVRQATPADTKSFMAALTNKAGGTGTPGGAPDGTTGEGPKPGSKYTEVQTLSLQDLISDATTDQINGDLDKQEQETDDTTGKPPADTAGNPPPVDTTDNPPPVDTTDNPPPPPPPEPIPFNVRVLTPAGTFTAFPGTSAEFTTDNTGGSGILGGDANPDVNADDFNWTFDLGTGRFKGTVTGLIDDSGTFQPATIDFPFEGLQCPNGVCPHGAYPIVETDNATITQDGQTTNYIGGVVVKPGFLAYDLTSTTISNDHPERLLLFGGTGYNFGTPSGKVYSFELTPDLLQASAFGPFASTNSSPATAQFVGLNAYENGNHVSRGIGFVSPLVLLEKDSGDAEDPSRAVWLQTNFFIGAGDNKGTSFINIALGEWDPEGGITGARRGGSIVLGPNDSASQTYSFSGDIASLAGPDSDGTLSHFMGSDNPNIVIGADSTGSHDIFRDTPLNPTDFNDTPIGSDLSRRHRRTGGFAAHTSIRDSEWVRRGVCTTSRWEFRHRRQFLAERSDSLV